MELLDLASLKASASSIGEKKASKFELKVDGDLSRDALLAAATGMNSAELKFVVRWFSGYRPDDTIANYDVASDTFTFSKGNLSQVHCETTEEGRLEIYPTPPLDRGNPIPGKVDPQTGTITIRVPYDHIQDYET